MEGSYSADDPTTVLSPDNLPYPITVTKLRASLGSELKRGAHLFDYFYSGPGTPGGGVKGKEYSTLESPFDGQLKGWTVKPGSVITQPNVEVAKIQQPCKHEVQVWGMCTACGRVVTQDDYNGPANANRVGIGIAHDGEGITVSLAEAKRLNEETTQRLLRSRKLALIVDLDQTIVHATVDPTVGEWIMEGEAYEARKSQVPEGEGTSQDESVDEVNPNWEALKDVKKFKLGGEELPSSRGWQKDRGGPRAVAPHEPGCFYYIKPRPGLQTFLTDLKSKYEMHVYTMGTRAYATEVCAVIDPKGDIFSERILSRDDSGNMQAKTLERLFPCDTSMVVVIDDRADIWGYIPNLVKVIPYNFFGIGDINAAGLPKQPDSLLLPPSIPPLPVGQRASDGPPDGGLVLPNKSRSMAGNEETVSEGNGNLSSDGEKAALAIAEAKSKVIEALVEERPLAKMQEVLDSAADAEGVKTDSSTVGSGLDAESGEKPNGVVKPKHKTLLRNDDAEISRIQKILEEVYERFYNESDSGMDTAANNTPVTNDVKSIIASIKAQTFSGMHMLFSSVIPVDSNARESEIWRLAESFGAACYTSLDNAVTHVVAAKRGTVKVETARKRRNVKIVWLQWFLDCIAQWRRIPETGSYLMEKPWVEDSRISTDLPGVSSLDDVVMSNGPEDKHGTEERNDSEHEEDAEVVGLGEVDWDDIDKEVDDFLNESDGDGDGGDSDRSGNEYDDGFDVSLTDPERTQQFSSLGKRRRRSPASSDLDDSESEGPSSYPNVKRRTLEEDHVGDQQDEDEESDGEDAESPRAMEQADNASSSSSSEEESAESGENTDSDDDFLAKEFG